MKKTTEQSPAPSHGAVAAQAWKAHRSMDERSPATTSGHIDVRSLSITYRTRTGAEIRALDDVALQVPEREFCVIVGPSGCGKSTLLKVLAGLIAPTSGTCRIGDAPVTGPRKDIGFVFQNPTLLPWASVLDNVLLPLKVQRQTIDARAVERARELLAMVDLARFARAYPKELSGGMQQRVGLARALMHDPDILLMDEPFGALDALTREDMNLQLQSIWMKTRKTVLFVTHSISEAVVLADKIVVMSPSPGRIATTLDVDMPRLRDFSATSTPEFAALNDEIRKHLKKRGDA